MYRAPARWRPSGPQLHRGPYKHTNYRAKAKGRVPGTESLMCPLTGRWGIGCLAVTEALRRYGRARNGQDPVEIRRRNLMPMTPIEPRAPAGIIFEGPCLIHASLDKLMAAIDYDGIAAERDFLARERVYRHRLCSDDRTSPIRGAADVRHRRRADFLSGRFAQVAAGFQAARLCVHTSIHRPNRGRHRRIRSHRIRRPRPTETSPTR